VLLTLGVSHKTAPIEVREKLAFSKEDIPLALKTLTEQLGVEEALLLSTCNRTEIYCSKSQASYKMAEQFIAWWQKFSAWPLEMKSHLYFFSEEKAVQHLMRVASGLDSMIIGEPQILGQLKNAVALARENGSVGTKLYSLFQRSFSTAKKVRTHTEIANYPVSVAYAAVSLAKQIFSDLSKAKVVLIGAGENIELTLRHLREKNVQEIVIVNRTLAHAKNLADTFGVDYKPLTSLVECLSSADIVISAIDCMKPIVTHTEIELALKGRKRRPIFIVDLGVPRNIEPTLCENEDIYLYSIDDLKGLVTENLKNRQVAALRAESIILRASEEYMAWDRAQKQIKLVKALRNKAHTIKEEALECALRKLENGEDPKALMSQFAHQLTQKLLHEPTVMLRKACHEKSEEELKIAKELFNLEY
jgi:glutamyl-tRNA reductase